MARRASLIEVSLLVLAGCASQKAPPKEDTALLARLAAIEARIDEAERGRSSLALRISALEGAAGKKQPDDDLAARAAALETRLPALEARIAALEQRPVPAPVVAEEPAGKVIDRRRDARGRPPAEHEAVKPLAAIDGETFSFVHGGAVDLARLAGVEVPIKDALDDRKKRERDAWGEAVDLEAAAAKVRARLEELLAVGTLSFTYPDSQAPDRHALLVFAHVAAEGRDLIVNEVLLREGLALAASEARPEYSKLEAEARGARRGFFAGK